MPMEHAWRVCELCGYGANEPAVQPSVALIRTAPGQGTFMDVMRCKRVDDCQARAAAAGRDWPVMSTADLPKPVRHR